MGGSATHVRTHARGVVTSGPAQKSCNLSAWLAAARCELTRRLRSVKIARIALLAPCAAAVSGSQPTRSDSMQSERPARDQTSRRLTQRAAPRK